MGSGFLPQHEVLADIQAFMASTWQAECYRLRELNGGGAFGELVMRHDFPRSQYVYPLGSLGGSIGNKCGGHLTDGMRVC